MGIVGKVEDFRVCCFEDIIGKTYRRITKGGI